MRRCNSKRVDAVMPRNPHEKLNLIRRIASMEILSKMTHGGCWSSVSLLNRLMVVPKVADYPS
jgi:hypothetical protein